MTFADATQRPLTLGTAGHIDHGKTTLVKALTGVDTDRLPDEKRRGISIELGYAQLVLPSGRKLSVIDVPGHERLVRTMVAGATGVDMFLLVVAGNEGPMPQTYEHLHVLKILGVKRGLVAVTKWDRVDEDRREPILETICDLLEHTGYSDIPVLEVDALSGKGLDELTAAIDELAAEASALASHELQRQEPEGECRLPIDRVFTIKGAGTVVTGTLWSGSIAVGDRVQVLPSRRRARVREVQVHDKVLKRAVAGQRVALNLAGVSTDSVKRGDVVVTGLSELEPTLAVEADVELLKGIPKIRSATRLHIHHGTRTSPVRIRPLVDGAEVPAPGAGARVRIRLEYPLVASAGDRFVLRTVAPPATVGGGVIVDAAPRYRGGNAVADLSAKKKKAKKGKKKVGGPVPVGGPELLTQNLVLARQMVRLLAMDGYAPRSPYAFSQAIGIDTQKAAYLLDALASGEKLVKVAEGIYYLPKVLANLREEVEEICERNGGEITIATLRDRTGISRKYAQAVLEYLDLQKLTRRVGDVHKLRRSLP